MILGQIGNAGLDRPDKVPHAVDRPGAGRVGAQVLPQRHPDDVRRTPLHALGGLLQGHWSSRAANEP